jgi:hypothetical protein
MEINAIPMAAFARFYEATGPQKVAMVRDARLYQSDPDGYTGRDYYYDLRNTLRQTHWKTDDIAIFEVALDPLLSRQKQEGKREDYRAIGQAYISFWRKRDAHFFDIPGAQIDLAGLPIRVSTEVGMVYHGDNLALKLWFNAPRATRAFRQAIKYMMEQGRHPAAWRQDWQAAIWDVRREEVLPEVPTPRDLERALEGQAGAFQQIWKRLES